MLWVFFYKAGRNIFVCVYCLFLLGKNVASGELGEKRSLLLATVSEACCRVLTSLFREGVYDT